MFLNLFGSTEENKKKDCVLCIRVETTTRDLLLYQQRCTVANASSLSVGHLVCGEW